MWFYVVAKNKYSKRKNIAYKYIWCIKYIISKTLCELGFSFYLSLDMDIYFEQSVCSETTLNGECKNFKMFEINNILYKYI